MKNILNAKPLSPKSIKKIDQYFKSKSPLFDTFDEIFLHIGFILDDTNRSPSEMVELAIEDIVFDSQADLQKHISRYFYFHNSIVRFLELIENASDGDEVLNKTKKISKALLVLCDNNTQIFQQRVCEEVIEIIEIVGKNYNMTLSYTNDNLEQYIYEQTGNATLAATLSSVIHAIPFMQNGEYNKKDAMSVSSTFLLSCMVMSYLRKEVLLKK